MNNSFPNVSSKFQTIKINELLGSYESYFTLNDVINNISKELVIDGKRGDMFISYSEISYVSIDSSWKINLVKSFEIPVGGDIFDAFITYLEWNYKNQN